MKFAIEKFADDTVLLEIQTIANIHLAEVGPFQFTLDVDWHKYIEMEASESCYLFTARNDEGILVGYAIYLTMYPIHFSSTLFAYQDALYMDPKYRGNGKGGSFMAYIEEKLSGCDALTQAVTPEFDYSDQLKKNGYTLLDSVYVKTLSEGT